MTELKYKISNADFNELNEEWKTIEVVNFYKGIMLYLRINSITGFIIKIELEEDPGTVYMHVDLSELDDKGEIAEIHPYIVYVPDNEVSTILTDLKVVFSELMNVFIRNPDEFYLKESEIKLDFLKFII